MNNFNSLDEALKEIEPGGKIIDFEYDLRPRAHQKLKEVIRSVWESACMVGNNDGYNEGGIAGVEEERERVRKMIEERTKVITMGSMLSNKERGDVFADVQHTQVIELRRLLESLT